MAGYVLGSYALIENRFFSGMVRLQVDRGQRGRLDRSLPLDAPSRVCRGTRGIHWLHRSCWTPYWAFLPVVFLAVTLVIRTSLEDRAPCRKSWQVTGNMPAGAIPLIAGRLVMTG